MIDTEKIKYFLYARRSVEKRDSEEKVVSIESQIKEMKELAKKRGLTIVGVFSEAKSAKEPYVREQFTEMMKQLNAGKANGIICFALNRLARNSLEDGQIRYFLQKEIIKKIITPEKDHNPEDNVLLASLDFGIATQYSIDLARHVSRGLRAACSIGYRPSFAPLGYKNSRYHQKGKQEEILVDEERFFLVRKIFDYVLSGKYTGSEVYRIASEELSLKVRGRASYSSKMMSKSYFFTLLSNPFYYGEFRHGGIWYKGNHVPMITKDEYYRVQEIINGKAIRPQKNAFTYTGIIRCGECGGSVTAEKKTKTQLNGNVHHYVYYHCTKRKHPECTQQSITETELEEQLFEYLKELHIPQPIHDWALEALKEQKKVDEGDIDKVRTLNKKAYTDCQNKLTALLDMRLAGELSSTEYNTKKTALEAESAKLKEEMLGIGDSAEEWFTKVKDTLDFAQNVIEEYKKDDKEIRRTILQSIGSNHLLKDNKLIITMDKPFVMLSEMRKEYKE